VAGVYLATLLLVRTLVELVDLCRHSLACDVSVSSQATTGIIAHLLVAATDRGDVVDVGHDGSEVVVRLRKERAQST